MQLGIKYFISLSQLESCLLVPLKSKNRLIIDYNWEPRRAIGDGHKKHCSLFDRGVRTIIELPVMYSHPAAIKV